MISKSENHNPNYLCKVIVVKNLRKHTNADKLLVFTVDGNDIITSNQTQEGQVSIYFPLECQINHAYLAKNNDYRANLGMNEDPEALGGFFQDNSRVKAVKLRGQKSEGYVVPITSLSVLIGDSYKELENHVGEEFDTIKDILLVNKYVPRGTKTPGQPGNKDRDKHKFESRLVDNQFRLHYDTAQLGKNLHKIQPNDLISISWKLHGTSFVSSKILCKRKLNWKEQLVRWFGFDLTTTEYTNVYSSRKVIKNEDINKDPQHFYGYDLWSDINDRFKDQLHDGETIYGECVGFIKDGGYIQKGFDYNCEPGESRIYVYRITYTTPNGKVIDVPFNMMAQRCEQLGVETVPLIYFGKAKDVFAQLEGSIHNRDKQTEEEFRDDFFKFLKEKYVHDQDSIFCKAKAPEEGIVVRIEGLKPEALKLKAFRFLEGETKALDKGEINIEDEQSNTVDEN
jgi:tRNA-binding EMAP/Myf-like protein